MKSNIRLLTLPLLLTASGFATAQVVRPSDVVFMYSGSRATYEAYGATVLAWGGTPTPQSLAEARGVKWFGSVGMVTEFNAYHARNPGRYQEGLCRDIDGQPVKVPWLVDHQSQGVPYWWCCTRQPLFREFLRQRVVETIKAGAFGLHIDDHLGTAGGLWLGICFCDRCVDGFPDYLATLPAAELEAIGVKDPASFNYRDAVKAWIAAGGTGSGRKPTGHPMWRHWSIYQGRGAAAFMLELRELARETAGHPVSVGANAGLLWPGHLVDYQALDLFTAETDHHASTRRPDDLPMVAYRLAESMGRPYAATASGADWAFIKEHNLPGLVRSWIAFAYAAGQRLMAPHHQWCHTPEKGTHWYDGPTDKFAPLYRFVRTNAAWFDDYGTYADVAVVLPYRSFVKNPGRWFELGGSLAAGNLNYRLLVAGDETVEHPLDTAALATSKALIVVDRDEMLPADRDRLAPAVPGQRRFDSATAALAAITPAVRVSSTLPVRVLSRVRPGAAVIHVLNRAYDSAHDDFTAVGPVTLTIDAAALGLSRITHATLLTPEGGEAPLEVRENRITLPRLELWALVRLQA